MLKTRCRFCHAHIDAGPVDLLPRVIGLPQLSCKRCDRANGLSLLVAFASSIAGVFLVAFALACCRAVAVSMSVDPTGTVALLLMLPVGLAAWMLGYLAFAVACYGVHGIWKHVRGISD